MKMKKKLLLTGLLLTAALLQGCGAEEKEITEITLIHGWGMMEPDHVTMRNIYKDFEKENPDIHLNLVSMPDSLNAVNKVNDLMSVGRTPDLFFAGGLRRDDLYDFAVSKGYVLDLMPYIEEDPAFRENIAPEILDYWKTQEGCLYTVSDVLLLSGGYWYNRTIFDEAGITRPPDTWEEFYRMCDRLEVWSEKNGRGIVPIQVNADNSVYLIDSLMNARGAITAGVRKELKMQFDPEQLMAALTDMERLYRYGRKTDIAYGYRDLLDMFNSGRAAMYMNGVWAGNMIEEGIDAGYALLPTGDGEATSCVSACLGYMAGNTRDERRMDASLRFLKYIVREDVQDRILKETGQIPSNPKLSVKTCADQLPRLYQASQEVLNAPNRMQVPDNLWNNVQMQYFKENIMKVMEGRLHARTFVDKLK